MSVCHKIVQSQASPLLIPSSFSCITHCVSNSFPFLLLPILFIPSFSCLFYIYSRFCIQISLCVFVSLEDRSLHQWHCRFFDIVYEKVDAQTTLQQQLITLIVWVNNWNIVPGERTARPASGLYLLDYAIIANSTSRSARRYASLPIITISRFF